MATTLQLRISMLLAIHSLVTVCLIPGRPFQTIPGITLRMRLTLSPHLYLPTGTTLQLGTVVTILHLCIAVLSPYPSLSVVTILYSYPASSATTLRMVPVVTIHQLSTPPLVTPTSFHSKHRQCGCDGNASTGYANANYTDDCDMEPRNGRLTAFSLDRW